MSFEQWILLILSTAGSVGGALWVVAKVIIPKIVDAKIEAERERRKYERERQQEEWTEKRRQQETRDIEIARDKGEALAIAREMIEWSRADFSVMQHTMEQQGRVLEQIRSNLLTLAGEVARLNDKKSKE